MSETELYPEVSKQLFTNKNYELKFEDISEYKNQLHANVYNLEKKTEEQRCKEIGYDMLRNGFELDCQINYIDSDGNPDSMTLQYPTKLEYEKLNFEKDYILEDINSDTILKHQIFLILHMLYTHKLYSLITSDLNSDSTYLSEEINYVLGTNKIKNRFLKLYRENHTILVEKIKSMIPKIHLATLMFDQNMFGDLIVILLKLYNKLLGLKPTTSDGLNENLLVYRVPDLRNSKLSFNINAEGELESIDMEIKNTFLFIKESTLKISGGEHLSYYREVFDTRGLESMFDLVHYKLDTTHRVKITTGNSPAEIIFNLESKIIDKIYKCITKKYILPFSLKDDKSKKKTKKNIFKRVYAKIKRTKKAKKQN